MVKILHLYNDLMNLYGEYGNVVVLKKHLQDQGLEAMIINKSVNESVSFENYDFIYCGSGTEKNQLVALKDLLTKKEAFIKAIDKDIVCLFTGNACEMLGKRIGEHEALGLVDYECDITDVRYTGDVVLNNKEIGEIVGFINKCTHTTKNSDDYLFTYEFVDPNLKEGSTEGFYYRNVFATHVIGPLLVKNPNFMKKIVTLLGKRENSDFVYKDITYPFEEDSYQVTLTALKGRK